MLTLVGSAAEVVSGLIGNITASSLTGALTVTTGDATDNTIAITTGSAATSITDSFNTDTVTVTATALAQNTALTLSGSAAEVVTGLVGDINAGSLTGALTVTTGNAADNGIIDHHRLGGDLDHRQRRQRHRDGRCQRPGAEHGLTLAGSAAEVVTGLVGDIAAGSLTGALTVTTGDAADNGISDHHRLGGDLDHRQLQHRHRDGECDRAGQNTALTLVGSAAEVVTGLVGNITAGSLTGALTVTTGNATDNSISITTGSAATSITDSGDSDIVTVTATALAQNTALTLVGICGRGGDRTGRGYRRRFSDRCADRDHG